MTDSKDDKFNRTVKNMLRTPPNPHKKEKNDDQGASAKNSPDRRPKPRSKT